MILRNSLRAAYIHFLWYCSFSHPPSPSHRAGGLVKDLLACISIWSDIRKTEGVNIGKVYCKLDEVQIIRRVWFAWNKEGLHNTQWAKYGKCTDLLCLHYLRNLGEKRITLRWHDDMKTYVFTNSCIGLRLGLTAPTALLRVSQLKLVCQLLLHVLRAPDQTWRQRAVVR